MWTSKRPWRCTCFWQRPHRPCRRRGAAALAVPLAQAQAQVQVQVQVQRAQASLQALTRQAIPITTPAARKGKALHLDAVR